MFHLYHHHDLAQLADLLTALRRLYRVAPLATDTVLVPNTGLGRWLKLHLAERDGIAANVATELPAPFLWQILASSLPGERADSSAYRRENLRWHLYALLPELAGAVPRIGRYLGAAGAELRRWQLAERLAALFDEYLIYRREMLLAWERGLGEARAPADWQAPLWRALVARLGPNHRARLLGELVARVEANGPLETGAWPVRVYCFGLGNLPPDYLRLLYAMGQRCDVHFLMHNPSDGYWGDIERRPVALDLEADAAPLPGEDTVQAGHPLLASLGYAGRDFLRLIYSEEFAGIREFELGDALAYTAPGDDTLLHRLQSGVIRMDAGRSACAGTADDHSFQMHACHGALREVQVLHDQLLGLLAWDPTLEPRDIIVMAPDIAEFAPAIEAVFGAADGAAAIPFTLADQPRRGSHPVVLTFRTLLDLPLWRWTASEITALLAVPAIMRRYDLDAADVRNLEAWIARAGIRWGLDAGHRFTSGAGDWAQNSWTFGLDRLIAGVAVSDPDLLLDGVAPVVDVEGGATAALGQLWLLVDRLRHWRGALAGAARAADWQARLNALCADLFEADRQDRAELAALATVTDAVAVLGTAAARIGDAPLSWEAVREIIDGELDASGPRQPFLAGGVNVCGLVPQRAVPFRVVCLLGMNEGQFPRQDRHRAISLIRRYPRLGDANLRDDDRQLLLQWLLAARDVFYVSYTGQDTTSGESLAPATAVAELLDFVASNQFADLSRTSARLRLVTHQPMQPFSARYFQDPGDPRIFTFRGAWRPGTAALFASRVTLPTLVDGARAPLPDGMQIELEELKRFFEHPARYFLQNVMQLDLSTGAEAPQDEEPLDVEPRELQRLRQALFGAARSGAGLPTAPTALVRARGELPPPPLDTEPYQRLAMELNALAPVWHHAHDALGATPVVIDVTSSAGWHLDGRLGDVYPEGLRRVDARRLGAAQRLGHWIDLLALAATGRDATLVCCGFDRAGDLDLRVARVDAAFARTQLDVLAAIFQEGQQIPLVFLPDLALDYVEARQGDRPKDANAALDAINRRLANDFSRAWQVDDPWFATVLDPATGTLGADATESPFCDLAERVMTPLVDALVRCPVEVWLATAPADGAAGR